ETCWTRPFPRILCGSVQRCWRRWTGSFQRLAVTLPYRHALRRGRRWRELRLRGPGQPVASPGEPPPRWRPTPPPNPLPCLRRTTSGMTAA
ncbi:hypothetical protein GOODEAATRI_034546, partial [Goodea atripinnis]